MWLTDKQLEELTKRKQIKAQVAVLVRDEVPFKMVAGRPVVMARALEPVQQSATRPRVRKLGEN